METDDSSRAAISSRLRSACSRSAWKTAVGSWSSTRPGSKKLILMPMKCAEKFQLSGLPDEDVTMPKVAFRSAPVGTPLCEKTL